MTEQTPSEPQNPNVRLIRRRNLMIALGILGAPLIAYALCIGAAFGPGVSAQDVVIGTELDKDGHVLKADQTIPADVELIYLGFDFHNPRDEAVTLQFCWFYENKLLYCNEQSYEDAYVIATLDRSPGQLDGFPAGNYRVLVYDFVVVEDHVLLGEAFVVQ